MKILIITSNVGRTAPGIVFERLIQGLSYVHQIDVLTADYDPSINLDRVCNIITSNMIYLHPRIYKLLISLFGINPYDLYWAWKSKNIIRNRKLNQYDIIFSFLSYHHYAALIAGNMIAKVLKCKFVIYSVDAVPTPIGWPENFGYRKGVKRLVAKYLSRADVFFSANEQMLDYQLSMFVPSENLITDILFNPSIGQMKEFSNSKEDVNYFVYTGGIYGVRNVRYLLEGFEKLLEIHPDSKLLFIGSRLSPTILSNLKSETLKKMDIVQFTKNLDLYYTCATALIDIDADLIDDVFLSSKIINYLTVNRIIISETGKNSPSRNLFKNINSIIQCDHNATQLCDAMKKSIEMKHDVSFDDRQSVLELFSIKNIVRRFDNSISNLKLLSVIIFCCIYIS